MFVAEIKQTEPMTVAYIPMQGSYSRIPEAFQKLYQWIGRHGLTPAGMPGATYFTMPQPGHDELSRWELWAPLAPGAIEAPPDVDGVGVEVRKGETVASTVHKGPYDTVGPAYDALGKWIEENGHSVVGPPHEIYMSDENVPPEETLTEIQFPVRQPAW